MNELFLLIFIVATPVYFLVNKAENQKNEFKGKSNLYQRASQVGVHRQFGGSSSAFVSGVGTGVAAAVVATNDGYMYDDHHDNPFYTPGLDAHHDEAFHGIDRGLGIVNPDHHDHHHDAGGGMDSGFDAGGHDNW